MSSTTAVKLSNNTFNAVLFFKLSINLPALGESETSIGVASKSALEKFAQLSSSGSEEVTGALAQGFPESNATATFDSTAIFKEIV